ncbi:hypothetical protein [Mycolicibacterium canariasense]|uniref:hypothetical protein n=1 Tax=Mycolicibacterium canariasense TaxID=228230 RepID=UPI0032D56F42
MSELTTADVETFTRGRLSAADPVVQDILDAALVRARNYTGWQVSPMIVDDTITLDGPGGRELFLPTRKIVSVASIAESGVSVDADDYVVSADIPRMVYRQNGCWTREYCGLAITYTHGFSEAEAADWRRAILQMVDRMSREQQAGARSDDDLKRKKVDDVEYEWVDWGAAADRAITSVESVLDFYRLTPSGFA